MLGAERILALHREIVGIRSVSGEERALADLLADFLRRAGCPPERIGNSLLAMIPASPAGLAGPAGPADEPAGAASAIPALLFDTHLDTVPPAPGWTRNPFAAEVADGRVYGLGANDAKAAVAAMTAAFLAFLEAELPFPLVLALVEGEETRGTGTEAILAELTARHQPIATAVFGEPTGLDVAIAQKGLMVLELVARGDACHAAHASALGAENAARRLARDLVALEGIDWGPLHPQLGPITVEPTQLRAGSARNVLPAEATALLDVRITPALPRHEVVRRIAGAVASEVRVLSDRLVPRETAESALVVTAARRARPEARLYGSATLSDLVFLDGAPAIKCGPGRSERSHTADEYVLETEVLEGARFYTRMVRAYAELDAQRRNEALHEEASEPIELGARTA